MSQNVVVIQFDDAAEASAALKAIRDQHKENQIHLNDTAIISKDAEGKVHKVNEVSTRPRSAPSRAARWACC